MRIAQVTGTSGEGTVVELHETDSVEALLTFFGHRGIVARAIATQDLRVIAGTVYDGEAFEFPGEPAPIPATVEAVRAELDGLRQQAITEYVAQWGEASRADLWPLLDVEMREAASETVEELAVERYPAIAGFWSASFKTEATAADVIETAARLRTNKAAHSNFLRAGEIRRNLLLTEYAALDEAEQLEWSAPERWAQLS